MPNTGSAREVAPGRLANFEDSDQDFGFSPAISLPRRPRRRKNDESPAQPAPDPKQAETPRPDTAADNADDTVPADSAAVDTAPAPDPDSPQRETAKAAGTANGAGTSSRRTKKTTATQPDAGTKGPQDRVRPSNVHIPVWLLDPIDAKCKAEGLSHGEVIIVAIEAAYPRLKELIHPTVVAGGNLFASRRSRASRSTDGPLTPLNYRLREGDFATLDQLVADCGASSRGHLITAALTDYFRDQR